MKKNILYTSALKESGGDNFFTVLSVNVISTIRTPIA
jgi:hypothetical protein